MQLNHRRLPRHAAPGDGLLHKAPGHQGRLVQQHPRQGAALDQRRAGLVPPAKEQETVFMAPSRTVSRFSDRRSQQSKPSRRR